MKTFKMVLLFTILILFIYSCECWKTGNGTVKDKDTENPIDSVFVTIYLVTLKDSSFLEETYTNSLGEFTLKTGIPKSKCELDLVFKFNKSGYKQQTATNPYNYRVLLEKL